MMIRGKGNMKDWYVLVALVFVMVASVEVWGIRAVSAASPAKRITLRMMMPSEPAAMGVRRTFQTVTAIVEPIVVNVMEPLIDIGKNGEPVPKLATKWEHSSDLIKWRFYLRRGVKFHNGANFTARDVVEFAKWLIELEKMSGVYDRLPIKDAVAVDDYTVDLIFDKPQPLHLINGRQFLIPPVAVSRDNRDLANTQVIGTGPYRFVEWKRGQHIKLTKFDGYWGPKPQIDDVEITFRAEEAVRLAALMAGEVDWIYGLSPEQASRAPKVARMGGDETAHLKFDEYIAKEFGGETPFEDKRLRLAVDYAIDRKALVVLYGGFITPSLGQFASPGEFGFNPNLKSRPYDLEKARALVREAGAVGKTVTFVAPSDRFTKGREVAEALTYMIEQTGLKVKLMLMPHVESTKYVRTQGADRKYTTDISISTSDSFLAVEARFGQLFTEGSRTFSINDMEPTRLYNEVVAETDIAKREAKLAKAWAYVYEQAHYVPIFKLEWLWGIAKNLEWKLDIAGRAFIADMKFLPR